MSHRLESPAIARRTVVRHKGPRIESAEDQLAVEEPLEIRVGDDPLAVTMRTPGHDEELAAGFCFTEGVVDTGDDLAAIRPWERAEHGNVVQVEVAERAASRLAARARRAQRPLPVSSSCGLCGKQSIDRVEQIVDPLPVAGCVEAETLAGLPERMGRAQQVFTETGGLHAAALFDRRGGLRVLREDVGRHNAVDKIIGHELLLGRVPIDDGVLLVSGRASYEIVQKVVMARISVLCAVSAPSSLAVDLAVRLNLTLVGFLRAGRMNVYHDPGRIGGAPGTQRPD